MGIESTGTKLNTPALSKMFKDDFIEQVKKDSDKVGTDWENWEDEVCTKCAGLGKNPEHPEDGFCLGCEGTGIWYRLVYGIQDKLPYAYTLEHGVEFVKEAAKNYRIAYAEQQATGKVPDNIRPFILPKTLEMELEARGLTVRTSDPDMKRYIFNLVAREYPDFMCVPYKNF